MSIQVFIQQVLYEYSYFTLFGLSFVYFFGLYFGLAPLFKVSCEYLASKNLLTRIIQKEVTDRQISDEKRHSFVSILIFGTSIIPVIYLIRMGVASLLPNTFLNVMAGILLLILWNEVHFFIVHRTMHLNFFMKNFHYIHHQSRIPTVYSVYSFHWLEAFLLSTVPLTFMLLFPIAIWSIFIYPLISILLNYSGHCNHRFGSGKGWSMLLFGTLHNEHHAKGRKNYGFASNALDELNAWLKSKF
ncbi:MAG: sterol desaturase family protein [Saprospiraceae bacterium]|nr:sterol desaturase family protein [Saprospiraceae bacterium]